ncbi:max-binding protein MNT isoform X2 [Colias croceus]|uniref:max-binding protein MNT isoform X2 n=1 Tax=Colias crocea TaxID=72248 RepID=UPI001E27F050|nr:max-binding protein MNT isoform X2 [Colias croceus]
MGILMESSEGNSVGGNRRIGEPELFSAMSAPGEYYETLHTIAINTRETEFGSYVEPIPITLKAYKHMQTLPRAADGYGFQSVITPLNPVSQGELDHPMPSVIIQSPVKEDRAKVARPPKKKWIKEYLEEEPKSPVSVRVSEVSVARSNGVVRPPSPPAPAAPPAPAPALAPAPAPALPALALAPDPPPAAPPAPILDFAQEHSRPRTNSSHGPSQIPSPPSLSSGSTSSSGSGAGGRAGTREVHNKLEKNRRAHLKECFELLKRQLPAAPDDKKTSNLSILGSAIRYIQVLRRKERECEHEMERLAREKIAAQQRLAALKREVAVRAARRPRAADAAPEEKEREDVINGQVLGLPLKSSGSPPPAPRTPHSPHSPLAPHTAAGHTPLGAAQLGTAPLSTAPHTLNLSTKLRPLPVQLASTASQVVRASYGSRAGALTLTTIAPADSPAQMVGGGLVVGARALQLLSGAPLHVLHHKPNGITTENNRTSKENGIVTTSAVSTEGGSVVVSGLTPLVVSQSTAHLLGTHTLTHKMVETQMVKGSVSPLAVSAQYLSATTIVKPVVVVSGATPTAPPPAPPAPPPRDT